MQNKVDAYWQSFLQKTGQDLSLSYFESFAFGSNKAMAEELLALVLQGKKKATASSQFAYQRENTRLPQVGDYSIVTTWEGDPQCIIKTTAVTVLPFNEMTFEICSREGEDDNLASWQKGHRLFFTQEGAQLGYQFSEDMPVIFEDFEVVYR